MCVLRCCLTLRGGGTADADAALHNNGGQAMQQFKSLQPARQAAYLSNLAVDAKLRRQGIGRAMMAACEASAREAGKALSTHSMSRCAGAAAAC